MTALIETMHQYASRSPDARELVAELEFVWNQVKSNVPSSSHTSFGAPDQLASTLSDPARKGRTAAAAAQTEGYKDRSLVRVPSHASNVAADAENMEEGDDFDGDGGVDEYEEDDELYYNAQDPLVRTPGEEHSGDIVSDVDFSRVVHSLDFPLS